MLCVHPSPPHPHAPDVLCPFATLTIHLPTLTDLCRTVWHAHSFHFIRQKKYNGKSSNTNLPQPSTFSTATHLPKSHQKRCQLSRQRKRKRPYLCQAPFPGTSWRFNATYPYPPTLTKLKQQVPLKALNRPWKNWDQWKARLNCFFSSLDILSMGSQLWYH